MVPIGPVSALAVNALMVPVDASPVWTASARCPWPVSATLPAGTTWPSSATWPVSVTWPVSALAVQIGTISLLSTPAPAPSSQVLRLPLSAHTLETSLSQGTLMLDVLPPAFISTRSQAPVHVKTKPVPSKTITRPAHIAQVTEKPPVNVATRPTPKVPVKTTVHASASASTTIANIVGAPANLIPVYQAAGHRYGIPWTVLAAIHKTETDFATSNCAVSTAGAQGPMQFLPATFAAYGVAAPGHSGSPNINNVDDAIYTAAHMLAADGYQTSPSNAIFAYNHSRAYVRQIETLAGI
ncbi:lytic transglycosylase domain-containing protein [Alicyclobacillus curvatus]|nr:lytic transglycosylase domain-containing protein [Alicyclobacillus curvatus]